MNTSTISTKGVLLALAVVPVTIALWVIVWRTGFIASIVSFVTAYGAIWLYKLGSGGKMTKPAAIILVAIMLVAVALAFLAGMYSDMYDAYVAEFPGAGVLDADVKEFFFANLQNGELWSAYQSDIIMSLVFVAIGAGWELKSLFLPEQKNTKKA